MQKWIVNITQLIEFVKEILNPLKFCIRHNLRISNGKFAGEIESGVEPLFYYMDVSVVY